MIPLLLAKFLGIVVGLLVGILLFLLWQYVKRFGIEKWQDRRPWLLSLGLILAIGAGFVVEAYRAPIMKRVRYHMEVPADELGQKTEPLTPKRIRITQEGGLGFWQQPVYQRQLWSALFSFSFLLLLSRLKPQAGIAEPRSAKPLNVDKKAKLEELSRLLGEEKMYIDPGLTPDHLSHKLGLSRYQFSQLINEELGQNFYELVNAYRVDEALIQMQEMNPADTTFSALGFEVGFNSKASFYRAFKKKTGATPAAYYKALR